jgi:hypothetical protein
MEIEYELNIQDEIEFNLYPLQSPKQQTARINLITVAVVSVPLFIILGLVVLIRDEDIHGITYLILASFWVYTTWYTSDYQSIRRRLIKKLGKQNGKLPNAFLSNTRMNITADGIYAKSEFEESKTYWKAIREIVQTERYIYLYELPNRAFIIPKRAFPNEESFNLFVQTAKDYQTRALQ